MKNMKKHVLPLCLAVILVMIFRVSALAEMGQPVINPPEEAYKGVFLELQIGVGLFDYRNTDRNKIKVTISKDGKVVKTTTKSCTSLDDYAIISFKPGSTGKFTVKAENGSGLISNSSFTVKPLSEAGFVNPYINDRVRFGKSTITAETGFHKVNALSKATCRVKVQIKKGSTVLKSATYTRPDHNASNFYDYRKLSYKPTEFGTYKVVYTRYVNGITAGSETKTVRIIKKKDISTVAPLLFINFDQHVKKVVFFEDGITPGGVYQYKLYRSTTKSGTYKLFKTIKASNKYELYKYTQPETKYFYRVKVVVQSGTKTYTSKFSNIIATPATIPAPKFVSLTPDTSYTRAVLKWNKINGAESYIIHYKKGSGAWDMMTFVSGSENQYTTFPDANKITYKIQAYKHYNHYNIYGPFSTVKTYIAGQ